MIAYREFIRVCFSEYGGRATSARIRADVNKYKENWGQNWNEEWEQYFVSPNNRFDWSLRQQAYTALLCEQRKPLQQLIFSLAPSLFTHQVECADLSYRCHLVQPAYAKLITSIGENLGVSIEPNAVLATWEKRNEAATIERAGK